MSGVYHTNIEKKTIDNVFFREVLATTNNQQLVVMSIKPNDDIPKEIHPKNDQFIRIEKGDGQAIIGEDGKEKHDLKDGSIIMIPAGTWHRIINTSSVNDLKLYTIYSPPHHPLGTVNVLKPKEDVVEKAIMGQKGGDYKYHKYKINT